MNARKPTTEEALGDVYGVMCDVLEAIQAQSKLIEQQNKLLKQISEK
ncbi:hypothetical protein [Prescottella equi]